mmetsp:Transcript_15184/g.25300  ORF Transcript_15184/g.25300 Transcript_15184/m.25300 type:complete len:232 (+) Transcript_15184:122-817(+)
MDTDSSNSSELCDKFALIQAWQAVDRLITVVNHELKNCKDVENLTNYCENTGMITVKVSDYVASCQFSPEVWSRLFSRKKNSVKWRDLAKDEGRITFDNVSQPFERRKIQLHTSEMMRSCVPWDWFFKTMMKPSEQQGSAQEYLYPSTPGNNLVSQVTEGILDRTCKLITPVGNNGVMQNTELSVQNQNCRRRDTTICRSCEKLWNIVESRFESTRASQVALPGVPLCAAS